MNTYEITFERENGTTGSDRFTAATEAQVRRDFREVYRHGNGQIIKVELISTGTLATKEQERKALEKIKKIVEELGEGSYIRTAFAGCFEIAESNIENDFADSMKERYEQAKEDVEHFKSTADTLSKEVDSLREENRTLKEKALPQRRPGQSNPSFTMRSWKRLALQTTQRRRLLNWRTTRKAQASDRRCRTTERVKSGYKSATYSFRGCSKP